MSSVVRPVGAAVFWRLVGALYAVLSVAGYVLLFHVWVDEDGDPRVSPFMDARVAIASVVVGAVLVLDARYLAQRDGRLRRSVVGFFAASAALMFAALAVAYFADGQWGDGFPGLGDYVIFPAVLWTLVVAVPVAAVLWLRRWLCGRWVSGLWAYRRWLDWLLVGLAVSGIEFYAVLSVLLQVP